MGSAFRRSLPFFDQCCARGLRCCCHLVPVSRASGMVCIIGDAAIMVVAAQALQHHDAG